METTVNKQPHIFLSANTKRIIVDIIIYLFIALFIYTAASKITTHDKFVKVLGKSPLIKDFNILIAYLIPAVEIFISALLLLPATKKIGLISSLTLMVIFTVYLAYMVMALSGSELPCYCGGVISKMTWQNHIFFNIGFTFLAIIGIKLYKK